MEFHIEIIPETITHWLGIPITNTLITTWLVMAGLIIFALLLRALLTVKPGKIQNTVEAVFDYILDFMNDVLGDRKMTTMLFPLIATIFLFIWIANWAEFIPGIGSIGLTGECGREICGPLLRSVNTDLNVTLALAIVSMMVIQFLGMYRLGIFGYAKKFIDFSSPLQFFIGVIEFFSEASRLISFSFRLFGNIFAGEILITVMIALIPIVLPVPFMMFEMFIGFIQAAIFALLTLFFIKLAITPKGH